MAGNRWEKDRNGPDTAAGEEFRGRRGLGTRAITDVLENPLNLGKIHRLD